MHEALIALSAAIASRDGEKLRGAMLEAKDLADPAAVDEIVLQSHLFVGFPIALNAMILWREIGGSSPPPRAEGEADWTARGDEVFARVYGRNGSAVRDRVVGLHPDLDRWMVEGGYGRVIGRPGVDLRTRELCIVALLAVWNTPQQLHSHLRGALNAGATPAEIDRALEIAAPYASEEVARAARELWTAVRDRMNPAGTDS